MLKWRKLIAGQGTKTRHTSEAGRGWEVDGIAKEPCRWHQDIWEGGLEAVGLES